MESPYFCHPCYSCHSCHSCMVGVLMSSVLFPLKLSCFLTSNSLADVVGNQDAKDQDDAVDEGQLKVYSPGRSQWGCTP